MVSADNLTVRQLAEKLGYNEESIRRRIRTLRDRGQVKDTGNRPADYPDNTDPEFAGLVLYWLHPQCFLIDPEFPADLFPGKTEREPDYET